MADRGNIDWVTGILEANKGKSFVKRILQRGKYPVLNNPDGSTSTHSMAWAEADGKYFVYPTVIMDNRGDMKRLKDRDAWEGAMQTGNYIKFDTPDEADRFSKEYKTYWWEDGRQR